MKKSPVPLLLKLRLKGVKPPIWRDVAVSGNATLADLHSCIQMAFGWEDYHLHCFTVGKNLEFVPKEQLQDDWGWAERYDEAKNSVFEIFTMASKLAYEYDFGDGWQVDITCKGAYEKADVNVPRHGMIIKIKGEDNPPEDCGGVYGFMELLYYRQHPEECDDEIRERLAWYYPDEYGEDEGDAMNDVPETDAEESSDQTSENTETKETKVASGSKNAKSKAKSSKKLE